MHSYGIGEVLRLELDERHHLVGLETWESSPESGSTPMQPHLRTSAASLCAPRSGV